MRERTVSSKLPWLLSLVAACGAACSDGGSPPRLESCTAGWGTLGAWTPTGNGLDSTEPNAMAWADGILYLASSSGIKAVPENGGEPTTIAAETHSAEDLWVQGENVLVAYADRLYQVPRAGGAETLLLDGGGKNDPRESQDYVDEQHLLDGSYFYWTTQALGYPYTDETYIWRMPLAGGPVEHFGSAPIEFPQAIALTSDGVLVAGWDPKPPNGAVVVPFAGGSPRVLDHDQVVDRFVGADSGGVLWVLHREAEDRRLSHPLVLFPADGSKRRQLTRELPDGFEVHDSHADGHGGRFLLGEEVFDDDLTHYSIFFVTSGGSATRVACEPTGHVSLSAPALSPEALFLVVEHHTGEEYQSTREWQVVRIARPVPQP